MTSAATSGKGADGAATCLHRPQDRLVVVFAAGTTSPDVGLLKATLTSARAVSLNLFGNGELRMHTRGIWMASVSCFQDRRDPLSVLASLVISLA